MEEKKTVKKRVVKAQPKPTHVVMINDEGKLANVHVDEVENYKLGNYRVKEG